MKRRYGLIIIILLFLLSGIGARIISQHFTFDYLYRTLIKREFAANPQVELRPDRDYLVRIWYYPFYRTTAAAGREKDFFNAVAAGLREIYPNVKISIGRLSFLEGRERLREALAAGEPPDLYFNFSSDFLLDSRWQLPVEGYLDGEEKTGFYTLDWRDINRSHLWGWPFLVQEQSWLADGGIGGERGEDFHHLIEGLERETLLLNYPDLTLLRQLLRLQGLKSFELDKGRPAAETSRALREVFSWLHLLKEKELFALSPLNMDDRFLEAFFREKPAVIGPLNPWLENYLLQQGKGGYNKIELGLLQVFSISVFRQKKYLGDDHTRAVMETARLVSERYSGELAGNLGLKTAYRKTSPDHEETGEYRLLPEVAPGTAEYWEEVIQPLWLDFWEQGLTPAEVMARLNS